jgi:hypothetical protein
MLSEDPSLSLSPSLALSCHLSPPSHTLGALISNSIRWYSASAIQAQL